MICLLHDWVYKKKENCRKDNSNAIWYSKRICSKCGKIQHNNPFILWECYDTGYPINSHKLKNRWTTVGYYKSACIHGLAPKGVKND